MLEPCFRWTINSQCLLVCYFTKLTALSQFAHCFYLKAYFHSVLLSLSTHFIFNRRQRADSKSRLMNCAKGDLCVKERPQVCGCWALIGRMTHFILMDSYQWKSTTTNVHRLQRLPTQITGQKRNTIMKDPLNMTRSLSGPWSTLALRWKWTCTWKKRSELSQEGLFRLLILILLRGACLVSKLVMCDSILCWECRMSYRMQH